MIPEIALPRGAILLEEAAEEARSFAVGFWFPLGSRHEAASERGFVHFVEHMVFKGSARRSAQDFAREVDRVGGYLNAFTERDTLCFHCTLPARHWRLALDILVDLVFSATFPEKEFLREQRVIKSEILAAIDDPEEASHDALLERVWPGHPLSLKIAGETGDIDAATRDSLYDFYRRRIRPEHLVVSASGPIPAGEVGEELARLIDGLPGPDCPDSPYPAEDLPLFRVFHDFLPASISQVYLYEAVQLKGRTHPDDYYVLSVLNGALGESMSSRLFQSLREKKGLCYSVFSGFSVDRGLGLWIAGASSSPRLFPKLLAGLDEELDRLAIGSSGTDGAAEGARALSEEEVSESVSRIAGSFEIALDDPEYRMRRLAKQKISNGFALDAEETMAKILGVDKAMTDAMAERLFSSSARSRFAYGRKSQGVISSLVEAGTRDALGSFKGASNG